jgi:hypothetical protein
VEQRKLADGTVIVDDRGPGEVPETKGDRPGRADIRGIKEVRATDIEPYTGLRYLSKLFRFMAVIMVLLLVAEIATGLYTQGSASIPTLLGETSRLIVLAGVLWGTGDLAHLLIDVGHDVRASRIIAARIGQAAKIQPLVPSRGDHSVGIESAPLADRPVDRARFADRGEGSEGPPIP